MRSDITAYLRCPVCHDGLAGDDGAGRALRCRRGHSYDIARQGHVDLTAGRATHPGDSAAMVAARASFLAAGHYAPLEAGLIHAVPDPGRGTAPPERSGSGPAGPDRAHPANSTSDPGPDRAAADPGPDRAAAGLGTVDPPLVVDVGAGPGHFLAAVLDARPRAFGLALDIAQPAVRRAARAHARMTAARADTWRRLPLADAVVAVLLNVFAPRHPAEFRRVLRPDGTLVIAVPEPGHLGELVGSLDLLRVDPDKAERLAGDLREHFTPAGTERYRWVLRLGPAEVGRLVDMGPNAWHRDPDALAARIAGLPDPVTVTAAVCINGYRPR